MIANQNLSTHKHERVTMTYRIREPEWRSETISRSNVRVNSTLIKAIQRSTTRSDLRYNPITPLTFHDRGVLDQESNANYGFKSGTGISTSSQGVVKLLHENAQSYQPANILISHQYQPFHGPTVSSRPYQADKVLCFPGYKVR